MEGGTRCEGKREAARGNVVGESKRVGCHSDCLRKAEKRGKKIS